MSYKVTELLINHSMGRYQFKDTTHSASTQHGCSFPRIKKNNYFYFTIHLEVAPFCWNCWTKQLQIPGKMSFQPCFRCVELNFVLGIQCAYPEFVIRTFHSFRCKFVQNVLNRVTTALGCINVLNSSIRFQTSIMNHYIT